MLDEETPTSPTCLCSVCLSSRLSEKLGAHTLEEACCSAIVLFSLNWGLVSGSHWFGALVPPSLDLLAAGRIPLVEVTILNLDPFLIPLLSHPHSLNIHLGVRTL